MNFDDAYANAAYIDGADAYPPRWVAAADRFRQDLGARARLDIPYGPSDRQMFDLFDPVAPPKGTLIFVHGGYWKAFDKSVWSHFAAGALAHGWRVAMPGYDLCPDVRISQITAQIADAVREIAAQTSGEITLAGHSAGGHLVARMLEDGVLPHDVRARITRVAPISPLSDLRPLMHTSMNDTLGLDPSEAVSESPINIPRPKGTEVAVWVGANERPVFLEQANWLGSAWDADVVVVPERHHFDIIDDLADAQSELIRRLVAIGT